MISINGEKNDITNIIFDVINEPRSDKRDHLAVKVKSEIRKKDLAVVNNYRKFEEIIFTNNTNMSV